MTEIRPRTIYSVPGFSMTSAVSIIRPDVPAFATRSASRREVIYHDGESVDRGNMVQFSRNACMLPCLFINHTGRLATIVVRDNSIMQTNVILAIHFNFYIFF